MIDPGHVCVVNASSALLLDDIVVTFDGIIQKSRDNLDVFQRLGTVLHVLGFGHLQQVRSSSLAIAGLRAA